jgi:hypothetical protein
MPSPPVLIYRYLSGRPLDGRPGYPYLRPGEGRWAGWHRQVARIAVPAATITALHEPAAAEHTAVALGVGAAYVVQRRWKQRRFRRAYVSPTLKALAPVAGGAAMKLHVDRGLGSLAPRLIRPPSPARRTVGEWYGEHVEPVLRWPGTTAMRGAWRVQAWAKPATNRLEVFRRPSTKPGPRIQLDISTPYLTSDQCRAVSGIIHAKIPVADTVEKWDQVGAHVTATWTVRRRPPQSVGLPELLAAFDRLGDAEFYLGQTSSNEPSVISLDEDSPHIAISAGTGAGKSVKAQLVAVQVLRRGGRVVLLDRKGSHRWAIGLPGVDYCTKAEQMHNALLGAARLANQRNDEAFHQDDGWDPGARTLLICEELNATVGLLRGYWEQIREKGEPKASPAIAALADTLFMGRSAKVNVLAIAQMLTARAIGGPEARENFGIRCLSRYTKNAWQMLVPEALMPRASRVRGRWQVVISGVATEVQVCFLTRVQARAFAGVTGRAAGLSSSLTSDVTGNGTETGNTLDPLSEPVTLAQAIDEGVLPWPTKGAVKMRLTRARKAGRPVPEPVGKRGLQADLYRRGDLIVWAESERVS